MLRLHATGATQREAARLAGIRWCYAAVVFRQPEARAHIAHLQDLQDRLAVAVAILGPVLSLPADTLTSYLSAASADDTNHV